MTSVQTSIIIVTLNRPDCIRQCLERIVAQQPQPDQIIVVDSSTNILTRQVVENIPGVLYLRNENGYGRMTASRNIGLRFATGDIIAFLDDDAFAHCDWLSNLIATYTNEDIGAVGGRALNHQPGEAVLGIDEIGCLKQNGELSGYFAADPGTIVEVDHVMGCNMSFRREVLARLGGFREDYPGISGVREDSDMCLRVKSLRYRILFNPKACVDHIGAPQAVGKRFDVRYAYYSQRNHLVMLIRNFGPFSGIVWRYLGYSAVQMSKDFLRRIAGAVAYTGATLVGTAIGLVSGLILLVNTGRDPVRRDATGQSLTHLLRVDVSPNLPDPNATLADQSSADSVTNAK